MPEKGPLIQWSLHSLQVVRCLLAEFDTFLSLAFNWIDAWRMWGVVSRFESICSWLILLNLLVLVKLIFKVVGHRCMRSDYAIQSLELLIFRCMMRKILPADLSWKLYLAELVTSTWTATSSAQSLQNIKFLAFRMLINVSLWSFLRG